MPPRPVTLATAGRLLTGPPEGYGPKQEVKVKRWIHTIPAVVPPPASEPSGIATELDPAAEELYNELEDSTDLTELQQRPATAAAQEASRWSKAAGRDASSHSRSSQSNDPNAKVSMFAVGSNPRQHRYHSAAAMPRSTATSLEEDVPTQQLPAAGPAEGMQHLPAAARRLPSDDDPVDNVLLGTLPAGPSGVAQPQAAPPGPVMPAAAHTARDLAAGVQATPAATALLAAAGSDPAALRQALLQALADKQALEQQLDSHAMRAKVRELEQGTQALRQQVLQAQAQHKQALDQLGALGESSHQAMQQLRQQLWEAQQHALAVSTELSQLRATSGIERTKLEGALAAARDELRLRQQAIAALQQEKAAALQGWQEETEGRLAAEQSERRALDKAAEQAEIVASLKQVQGKHEALSQQVALGVQRAAAIRGASVTELAAAGSTCSPSRQASSVGKSSVSALDHQQQQHRREAVSSSSLLRRSQGRSISWTEAGGDSSQALDVELGRHQAHRSLSRAVAGDRRALQEALKAEKRVKAQAELQASRQHQEALAVAPERLRALGLAFRAYIMAGTAAAGSLAAGLAEQLAQDYRVYVDPAAVLPCGDSAEAAPAAGSSRASMCATSEPAEVQQPALRASSLVGVSAAVVCVAAAGMLTHEAHVAELQQACSSACQLVLACPAELTIDQLFHPSGTDSSGSSPSLPDDALDYLQRAWTQRIQISSTHMRASVTGTIPAEPEAVAAAVSSRLGLPDAVLALLPDDIQRKLSKAEVKAGRHLDLAHLNRAGIGQLRMDLSGLAADVAQRVAEALCAMLGGNTSIKTLQLKGFPASAAPQLAKAITRGGSAVGMCTLNVPLPVGALLGRPGPAMRDLDLASFAGFRSEDALLLAAVLAGAEQLQRISLPADASLSAAALQALTAAVLQLPALEWVNGAELVALQGEQLECGGRALGPVGGAVVAHKVLGGCGAQLTSLQAINLAGCHLGPQGLAALAGALAKHPPAPLTSMGLADNKLGAAGLQHLAKALSSSSARLGSSLTCLDLSLNDIGTDGCRQLAQLCSALPSMGELSLAANSIRAEGMQALAPQLQELAALSALRLHGNALGDAGFGALAAALPGLPLLAELQLQENHGVGAEGVRLLASALAACESLTTLDLSKTGIGVEGGKQLGALLQAPGCQLAELSVERCGLRAEGVELLAEGVAACSTLRSLGLARNGAGDMGTKALAQVLEGNSSISRLDLRSNGVGLLGCKALSSLLKDRNASINKLSMAGNAADNMILEALEQLAATKRTVKRRTTSSTAGRGTARSASGQLELQASGGLSQQEEALLLAAEMQLDCMPAPTVPPPGAHSSKDWYVVSSGSRVVDEPTAVASTAAAAAAAAGAAGTAGTAAAGRRSKHTEAGAARSTAAAQQAAASPAARPPGPPGLLAAAASALAAADAALGPDLDDSELQHAGSTAHHNHTGTTHGAAEPAAEEDPYSMTGRLMELLRTASAAPAGQAGPALPEALPGPSSSSTWQDGSSPAGAGAGVLPSRSSRLSSAAIRRRLSAHTEAAAPAAVATPGTMEAAARARGQHPGGSTSSSILHTGSGGSARYQHDAALMGLTSPLRSTGSTGSTDAAHRAHVAPPAAPRLARDGSTAAAELQRLLSGHPGQALPAPEPSSPAALPAAHSPYSSALDHLQRGPAVTVTSSVVAADMKELDMLLTGSSRDTGIQQGQRQGVGLAGDVMCDSEDFEAMLDRYRTKSPGGRPEAAVALAAEEQQQLTASMELQSLLQKRGV